jgi:hypothetical protein
MASSWRSGVTGLPGWAGGLRQRRAGENPGARDERVEDEQSSSEDPGASKARPGQAAAQPQPQPQPPGRALRKAAQAQADRAGRVEQERPRYKQQEEEEGEEARTPAGTPTLAAQHESPPPQTLPAQCEEKKEEHEEPEDLDQYLQKLASELGMSARAGRALLQQMRKASIGERLRTVNELEREVETMRGEQQQRWQHQQQQQQQLQHQHHDHDQHHDQHHDDRGPGEQQPQQRLQQRGHEEKDEEKEVRREQRLAEQVSHEPLPEYDEAPSAGAALPSADGSAQDKLELEQDGAEPDVLQDLLRKGRVDPAELDQAWEALVAANLPRDKQALMREQFAAEPDIERRFHMYMEFASYFRPLSKAGKQYFSAVVDDEDAAAQGADAALRPRSLPVLAAALAASMALRFLLGSFLV